MPLYYWDKTKTGRSVYGGTYYRFDIWKVTKKGLKHLGSTKINTASYYGDHGTVVNFLAKKEGYKLTGRGLHIKRKDVRIKQLP